MLVLNGDVPGLTGGLLRELVETHRRERASGTVLSFEPADVRAYGRIVRDGSSHLARIVEARDASEEELGLREVNSGIYVFRAEKLWPAIDRLEAHNAQGELYITDTLGFLVAGQVLEHQGVATLFAFVAVGMTVAALSFAAIALRFGGSQADRYYSGRLSFPISYPNALAAVFLIGFWPAVVLAGRPSSPFVRGPLEAVC